MFDVAVRYIIGLFVERQHTKPNFNFINSSPLQSILQPLLSKQSSRPRGYLPGRIYSVRDMDIYIYIVIQGLGKINEGNPMSYTFKKEVVCLSR